MRNILRYISRWSILFCFPSLFLFQQVRAQGEISLNGRILDAVSGNALVGASILDTGSGRGTSSGNNGEFTLNLRKGQAQIEVAYLGYHRLDTILRISKSAYYELMLYPDTIEYEEVTITANASRDYVNSVQMSEIQLKKEDIVKLPALMGESDPVRFLQLTPGVQSSTEGGLGFYVRGGGVDQNLVLYDHATIYNPGHLLGFVSVFNPDLIQNVSLIKSGIPARYGGRLSSVVRVNPERGRSDSLRIRGQLGMVSSRISLSRSFNGERGSFVVSARRASIDLIVKPLILPLVENSSPYFNESTYRFYDFNGGISYRIGVKDYFNFSAYYGNDNYGVTRSSIRGQSEMNWGNRIVTGKWTHLFSNRLRLGTSVSHTSYNFGLSGAQSEYSFNLASSIRDYNLRSQADLLLDNHKLAAGFELTRHSFTPNDIDVKAFGFVLEFLEFNRLFAYEGGLFLDDEFSLSDRMSVAMGIRYSFFNQIGPYKEYIYDELSQVKDSVLYPSGQSLAFYHQPEPRLSVKFQLNKDASLKASYMHMAQYVHLATASTVSLPMDIWLPSSRTVQPQLGDQVSLGYFRNWLNSPYESSVELYYKTTRNQIEFIRGVMTNSLHMTMEENLAAGDGRSYGAEFFLRKKSGELTGWIGYTIARTERQFDRINEGKIYPAKFDRRHDLSIASMYTINDHWDVSGIFIFVSGNAFTLPLGRYIIQGNLINEYGGVNNFRMPPYHRLDLSATRTRVTLKGNISSWNFSIFNVYNRSNPFYLYFKATGDLEEYRLDVEPEMISLFPVIPSVSWRFEF